MLQSRELLSALHQQKVEFLIIGGLAGIIHGSLFITGVVDICYKRDKKNYSALVKALGPYSPRLRTPHQEELPFLFDERTLKNGLNFTLVTTLGDIDLLGELSGIGGYEDLVKASEKTLLFELDFDVISLEDLIRAKRIAGRRKDKVHLDILEALQVLKKKSG